MDDQEENVDNLPPNTHESNITENLIDNKSIEEKEETNVLLNSLINKQPTDNVESSSVDLVVTKDLSKNSVETEMEKLHESLETDVNISVHIDSVETDSPGKSCEDLQDILGSNESQSKSDINEATEFTPVNLPQSEAVPDPVPMNQNDYQEKQTEDENIVNPNASIESNDSVDNISLDTTQLSTTSEEKEECVEMSKIYCIESTSIEPTGIDDSKNTVDPIDGQSLEDIADNSVDIDSLEQNSSTEITDQNEVCPLTGSNDESEATVSNDKNEATESNDKSDATDNKDTSQATDSGDKLDMSYDSFSECTSNFLSTEDSTATIHDSSMSVSDVSSQSTQREHQEGVDAECIIPDTHREISQVSNIYVRPLIMLSGKAFCSYLLVYFIILSLIFFFYLVLYGLSIVILCLLYQLLSVSTNNFVIIIS